MTTTAGKAVMFVGFIVLLIGLFVSMSTLVGLFMILAGIVTIVQGAKMKPLPKPTAIKQPETKTYTNLGENKDTKGPLSNYKRKGAV